MKWLIYGANGYTGRLVAEEARRRGQSRISVLWEKGRDGPEGFYRTLGFAPIGELFGETVGAKNI